MAPTRFFIQRSGRIKGPLASTNLQSLVTARKIKKSDRFSFSRNGPWSDLTSFQEQLTVKPPGSSTDPQDPDWDQVEDDAKEFQEGLADRETTHPDDDVYRPQLQAKRKTRKRRQEQVSDGSGRQAPARNNLAFMNLPGQLWEAIPTFVKALAIVVVVTIFAVVLPLVQLNEQWYNDNGGRFGQHSLDTMNAASYRNKGKPQLSEIHIERRELRKALVRADLLIDELAVDEILEPEEVASARQTLDELAKKRGLTSMMLAEGFFTPTQELLALKTTRLLMADVEAYLKATKQRGKKTTGLKKRLLGETATRTKPKPQEKVSAKQPKPNSMKDTASRKKNILKSIGGQWRLTHSYRHNDREMTDGVPGNIAEDLTTDKSRKMRLFFDTNRMIYTEVSGDGSTQSGKFNVVPDPNHPGKFTMDKYYNDGSGGPVGHHFYLTKGNSQIDEQWTRKLGKGFDASRWIYVDTKTSP